MSFGFRARALGVLLAAAAVAACSGDAAPTWEHLAAGHDPARNEVNAFPQDVFVARFRSEPSWFVWYPEQRAFTPVPGLAGVFRATRPALPEGVSEAGEADALTVAGAAWSRFDGEALLAAQDPAAHLAELRATLTTGGAYFGAGDTLFLLVNGEAVPDEIEYRTHHDRGGPEDGRWHVAAGRFGAEGLSVLPGEVARVPLAGKGERLLQFATVAHGAGGGEVTFRVYQAKREIFRHTTVPSDPPALERHRVELGSGDLLFEVSGTLSNTAFLAPIVGPRDVGSYERRPWGEDRPDLVIFLADTFRADNLAAYGGAGLETPHIDASLERALVFERAWAPSSWTLPSHASLFTGLFPYQHGAVSHTIALGEDAVTLAEHLRDAGYRTGAITDAGYVTREAGLAQGFEWFDQEWGDLDDALDHAEAFLDADDGRPVFLFFQTYRAHTPYAVDPAMRDALAKRLDLSRSFVEVHASVFAGGGWNPARDPAQFAPDDLRRFRDLYRAAVAGLDRGWGRFETDLRTRGLLESGNVLFTSDHGEAFWEHGTLGHGNGVHEEHLRIPLALLGRGVRPARNPNAASLVDVPRTFATIAALEPATQWLGRDLLRLDVDAPAYGWECNHRDEPSSRARIAGGKKWIVAQDALTLEQAFDLGSDPQEASDAATSDWASAGLPAALDELGLLEQALLGTGTSVFGPEAQARLRELGYLGGD